MYWTMKVTVRIAWVRSAESISNYVGYKDFYVPWTQISSKFIKLNEPSVQFRFTHFGIKIFKNCAVVLPIKTWVWLKYSWNLLKCVAPTKKRWLEIFDLQMYIHDQWFLKKSTLQVFFFSFFIYSGTVWLRD